LRILLLDEGSKYSRPFLLFLAFADGSMLPNTCGRSLLHRAVVFLNCGR
jgi:hypothetical protein